MSNKINFTNQRLLRDKKLKKLFLHEKINKLKRMLKNNNKI